MARQDVNRTSTAAAENGDNNNNNTNDARGGIRFTATSTGDAYSGEVGYGGTTTATDEYVTELQDDDDDDDEDQIDEGQQQASHPSTLQRQMVRSYSSSYYDDDDATTTTGTACACVIFLIPSSVKLETFVLWRLWASDRSTVLQKRQVLIPLLLSCYFPCCYRCNYYVVLVCDEF